MMTSLSALTLEVYYRYLPLYKLDKEGGGGRPPAAAAKPAADKPADKPTPSRPRRTAQEPNAAKPQSCRE